MKRAVMVVFVLLLGLGVLALAGCKVNLSTNLYSSDLLAVLESGKALKVEGELKFSVPSKKQLDEKGPQMKAIIGEYFTIQGDILHEKQGMDNFAIVKVELPLMKYSKTPQSNTPLYFMVGADNRPGYSAALVYGVDRKALDKALRAIRDKFMMGPAAEDISVTVNLHNDLRGDLKFQVAICYIDDDPTPSPKIFTLARRKSVRIRVAKVASDYAVKNGAMGFLSMLESGK